MTVETLLSDLYKYKGRIERELQTVARRLDNCRPKRLRPSDDSHKRELEYRRRLSKIKDKWHSLLGDTFMKISDLGIYDKIAYDLVRLFSTFRDHYEISDENLNTALEFTLIPAVCHIVDEKELSKRGHERQQRRIYFMNKLLTTELPEVDMDSISEVASTMDESIDVCTAEPLAQSQNQTQSQIQFEFAVPWRNQSQTRTTQLKITWLTVGMLEILFDTLMRHANLVTRDDFDMSRHIFHVINITHLVDILEAFLSTIKTQLEEDMLFGPIQNSNMHILRVAMESFEKKLWNALDLFTLENPWLIFKDQLDQLYFRLKLIRPLFRD